MALIAGVGAGSIEAQRLNYPAAPTDDTVDTYFGMTVKDPYRPLENDTASATLEWVKAENAVTDAYLRAIPFRGAVAKRLTELNDYAKSGLKWHGNDGNFYYFYNDGLKNQSVLLRGDNGEVFLDPNTLSDDGTVALTGVFQSPDGKLTAYTISRSGSDWTEIYVMDTATGRLLDDHIEWAKFTDAQWSADGNGFYYSAYPRPEAGKEFSNANEGHNIYYHRIGTSQADDQLVYADEAHPLHFHSAYVPEGTDLLFVYGAGEGNGESIMVTDRSKPGEPVWTVLEPSQDYKHSIVDVVDGRIYILTNYGAPRKRLMVADIANPVREAWRELVAESDGVLSGAQFAGDKLLLTYEKDAVNHVIVYDLEGKNLGELTLPGLGSVAISSSRKHPEVFYSFTSFTSPSRIYTCDIDANKSELIMSPTIKNVNLDDYVTEQVFYTSADGTRVPMFLTYKKGLKRDGNNPVLLYGYGGFNISLTPSFNASRLLWLENGGVYAMANLRGGSEYGEEWHQAGTQMQKLNVFNDFIAAAEYLIKEGWTNPSRLVIEGGSNGGLLVGAVTNMRPDLFKVAIPKVGVMDMMRYHLFTIGWNWASDYGTSADSPEMARYLLDYSPVHNIRNDATPYPAVLVTTADHDDRVVPAHSFKYAATLQEANTGIMPKLIRIDSNAGHGAGKPVSKILDEWTDIYTFIFNNMRLKPATAE